MSVFLTVPVIGLHVQRNPVTNIETVCIQFCQIHIIFPKNQQTLITQSYTVKYGAKGITHQKSCRATIRRSGGGGGLKPPDPKQKNFFF